MRLTSASLVVALLLVGCAVEEPAPGQTRSADGTAGANVLLLRIDGARAATTPAVATIAVQVVLEPGALPIPVEALVLHLDVAGAMRAFVWEHAAAAATPGAGTYDASWSWPGGGREAVAELRSVDALELRLQPARALPPGTTATLTLEPPEGPEVDATFTVPEGKPGGTVRLV